MSTVSLQQLFSFDDSSAFISDAPQKICALTASYRESIVMLNQYIYFKIVVKTPEKNQNVEIFENNKVKINNPVSVEYAGIKSQRCRACMGHGMIKTSFEMVFIFVMIHQTVQRI